MRRLGLDLNHKCTRLVLFLSLGLGLILNEARAQVFGYTDEKGVLILSNVPSDSRMRMIAEGNPEEAGRVWRYSGQYDPLILKEASLAGLDTALVKAVIAVESGFNRFARSHKGAMGLMQLMPATCKRYGVGNPYDARQNVRAGSQHLRDLLDEFKDVRLSLAAYNAGATPVRKNRGIPPYRETRDYVRKVMAIYQVGSRISITRGGTTYTMSPGGRTRVQSAPVAGKTSPLGEAARREEARKKGARTESQSPLADVATASRRVDGASHSTPSGAGDPSGTTAVAESAALASQESSSFENVETKEEPLYYRYIDPNGVIYITREKPLHPYYEVLQP